VLIKGTASEVAGMVSDTLFRNTVNERSIVTSKVSFSPESGGSVNPRSAMDEIRTQGTIRLKK
jgi:hypothetical protein